MKKTSFGTFFELGGRGAMEALTRTGLDYVIIDTEHGCLSVETTADMILAAENGGLLPYVRIGDTRRPYVLRMLDVGARGLIVPNIRSVEEVRRLVDAAKFPPLGNRGYCPTRTSGWGADEWARDAFSYMAACNERCKVIPQCETREALELQFDHPMLLEACERILAACRANSIEALIFAGNMKDAKKWAAKGFDSVAYSLDAGVLINAYQALIRDFRSAD